MPEEAAKRLKRVISGLYKGGIPVTQYRREGMPEEIIAQLQEEARFARSIGTIGSDYIRNSRLPFPCQVPLMLIRTGGGKSSLIMTGIGRQSDKFDLFISRTADFYGRSIARKRGLSYRRIKQRTRTVFQFER